MLDYLLITFRSVEKMVMLLTNIKLAARLQGLQSLPRSAIYWRYGEGLECARRWGFSSLKWDEATFTKCVRFETDGGACSISTGYEFFVSSFLVHLFSFFNWIAFFLAVRSFGRSHFFLCRATIKAFSTWVDPEAEVLNEPKISPP